MNEDVWPAAGAHQDAVEVVSSHVGGGSRQQRPRLALVVRKETLDLAVDQFVGQIHAVYAFNLLGRGEGEGEKTTASVSFLSRLLLCMLRSDRN